MLLSAVPAVAIASLFLMLPGAVWAWWRYPATDGVTRVSVGLALGLALQTHVVALLAAGPGITATSVVVVTLVALALAAALVWRTRPPRVARRKGGATPASALPLVALLAVIAAVRLAPLAFQQVPMGWDPSFHSLLASMTVTTGRLPTWAPYEPIPLNYPYGPHTFIAEITLLTGVAPDRVFAALISGVFPVLTCLALYALTLRLLRRRSYALAAVAAYGLLGHWGSVDYAAWGGLPNEIGFFLALTFFAVLFTPNATWRHFIAGGLILGAIPLAHHHVMLTVALLLGVFAAYLLVRLWRGDQEARGLLRNLALMALVAGASIAYYALPIALRVGQLQDTGATTYRENLGGPLEKNGVALEILAVAGAVALYATPTWRRRWLGLTLRVTRSARGFLAVTSLTLIAAFVVGHYLYGYISYTWLTHSQQTYSLFTPSRFLTDLTYFLAPFAAIPLVALWRWLGAAGARFAIGDPGAPQIMGGLAQGALLLAMVGVAASSATHQFGPAAGALAPGEAQTFAWVREHTDADTLALNMDPNAPWAPYFTRRESAITPVPTSEFSSGYVAEKQYLSSLLWTLLERPPTTRVLAYAGAGTALPALVGRPVAVLTEGAPAGLPGAPAFASGDQRVFLLADGYARLRPAVGEGDIRWWNGRASTPPVGWQASSATDAEWTARPDLAVTHRDAYLQLALTAPLAQQAEISCRAQRGADLWLDGRPLPDACDGAPHPLASGPGPHILAMRARWTPGQQPWAYLFVVAAPG
jgi:hypothetical protein